MNVLGFEIRRRQAGGSRFKWTRRAVVVGATASVVVSTGIAYAFWTTTGTGSGTSQALVLSVTANAAPSATPTNQLFPGNLANASGTAGGDLVVNLTNNKGVALHVTSVVQNGPVTVTAQGSGFSGCTSDTAGTGTNIASLGNSGVYVGPTAPTGVGGATTFTGYAVPAANQNSLAANATSNVTIPFSVSMASTSANNCQGATFSLPVVVTLST